MPILVFLPIHPQAPTAASELCELLGEPQLREGDTSDSGSGALHVRGAHGPAFLEQPAEAGHALPADGLPGAWALPLDPSPRPLTLSPPPARVTLTPCQLP